MAPLWPSLLPTGEEGNGADDIHLDPGQLGRKPPLETSLVVFEVREDALPVVETHQTAPEQIVPDAAAENRAPEEDTVQAR